MSGTEVVAQVIAAGVIGLLLFALSRIRRPLAVAEGSFSYVPSGGVPHAVTAGDVIPAAETGAAQAAGRVRMHRKTGLSSIVVGADNRLSTSKTMVFAWTVVIAYGLLALLIAKLLGDGTGWSAQVDKGLQEEYLLLLGGPYAAAIIAKLSATGQAETEGKPPAPPGQATATQLITDDAGDTDLGDLQYVLFNLIAFVFFLATFWQDSGEGFPDLPDLLAGLVLTSAGGYAAKKLIKQGGPTLTSVIPPAAVAGAGDIQLYGSNLVVPAAVSPTGTAMAPLVSMGGCPVTITASAQILGADRLTIALPVPIDPGATLISVVRADGIAALGPAGADGIPFTVS